MNNSLIIIGSEAAAAFAELRTRAEANVLDVHEIIRKMETDEGRAEHKAMMTEQTVTIKGLTDFYVTYNVESGHKAGTVRHISMSISPGNTLPPTGTALFVSGYLGFVGNLCDADSIYVEDLSDGGRAINIIQVMK